MHDTFSITGRLELILRDAKTGRIKAREIYKNLFVTTGKEAVARGISGNITSNNGQITYCAVGTSTTSPALGNTTLVAEIARKQISTRSSSGAVATFRTFFNQSEANGVLKEAGLFGEGASATTDSGTLFARTSINRTKSSSDTLTLSWTVTVG